MGAIKETAVAVKKTGRATQRTARGTTDWPMALFFGPLLDIRLRRSASETGLNPTHAAIRRRLEASTWARWLSVIAYIAVIALVILFFGWLLAPLIPVAWVILTRRRAWWKGQPTLRRMLSPGAWVTAGLSLIPPTVALFELLFEPLPEDVHGWVMNGPGWLAGTVAFLSALAVSERLNNPRVATMDRADAELVMEALDMPPAQFHKSVDDGTLAVGREGKAIRAQLPPGTGKLLEDRDAITARLARRRFNWELGMADAAERLLVLNPISDEETTRREALDLSKGLFDKASTVGADTPVIDLNIDWTDQSPHL